MTKTHLLQVDLIRGIAILLVLSYHILLVILPGFELRQYGADNFLIIESYRQLALSCTPFGQGWIGVQMFLVVSGFLIHLSYLTSKNSFSLKSFLSKRFWRIYPPYLLALVFFFINKQYFSTYGVKSFLYHVILIHNLNGESFFSINASYWSIALEWQLYIMYPLFLYLIDKQGIHKSLYLSILLFILFVITGLFYNLHSFPYSTFVFQLWFIWCAGAYLADSYHKGKRLFKNHTLCIFASYLLIIAGKFHYISSKFILIPATLLSMAMLEAIIYTEVSFRRPLSNYLVKQLSWIGICSYSIYLIHQPYLKNLLTFFNPSTGFFLLNLLVSVTLTISVIFLFSYSLYNLVELRSIHVGKLLREKKAFS